ncbi:HET-domain-containing protein [Hyaloscypha hepaticicola]|uniref:HET-domain-containing protein n=1 Tax=Hyaloscypha hepaticicola TaxID=2082293 RepID=A0A2J6PQH6_9HELO|nr:HET-domain-containing protein [Hyaloscypha hepaticicola]
MDSPTFPSIHSCDFCRTHGIEDEKSQDVVEAFPSPSPSLWTRVVERYEKLVRNTELNRAQAKVQYSVLEDYKDGFPGRRRTVFDCTIGRMKQASKAGCPLCTKLLHAFHDQRDDALLLVSRSSPSTVEFGLALPIAQTTSQRLQRHQDVEMVRGASQFFLLVSDPNKYACAGPRPRPINSNPSSDYSFSLARDWLENCLKTHKQCLKPSGSFMPTRVIEILHVRGNRVLRLRETRSEKPVPYAALTYCWGGEQDVCTTNKTLHRHLTRINLADLPATVRDAILVTEKLGLRWIWIDSFCILQDDDYDKAVEIGQMPLIYNQATITIAASRASHVNEGFLHSRYNGDSPETIFQLPRTYANGKVDSVTFRSPIETVTEPLDFRAWALQERYLSPRILEYGSYQTQWSCRFSHEDPMGNEHLFTDGFFERLNESEPKEASKHTYFYNITPPEGPSKAWFPKLDIREQWYELVKTYTHRKLSVAGDRLPAISGLAAYFSKALNDEYKAGLWKSKLPYELLWTLDDPDHLEKEPSRYQGPSWSWAAVNQRIRFFQKLFYADDCFEVVDCQTKTQSKGLKAMINNSEFGAVESGSLTLKGRLQMACWKLPGPENIDWSFRVQYRQHGALYRSQNDVLKDQLRGATMYLDAFFKDLTAEKFPISIYLMIVGRTYVRGTITPSSYEWIFGLVLKRGSATEYTRLGIFEYYLGSSRREDLDWLNSGEVQTITIV